MGLYLALSVLLSFLKIRVNLNQHTLNKLGVYDFNSASNSRLNQLFSIAVDSNGT